ncbi:MAG: molybdopterin-binding protein [Clostridium sp.]|nr:molybdopterin-binding protein [Clostridium sp.]MDU7084748.1 molybdopterin-binding protein [Clostridium sp.]
MKKVRVEDAIGMVVAHDLTKIVPGEFKGARFKKGHIIEVKDIEELKSMGKNHVYIMELKEDTLHEDEAAVEIGEAIKGENTYFNPPSEGKINITATREGILKIKKDLLYKINEIPDVVVSTLHNNSVVKKDTIIAAGKVTPLVIEKKYIDELKKVLEAKNGIIDVKPFAVKRVGIVITGTEVFNGTIKDKFAPVIKEKVEGFGACVKEVLFAPDDLELISKAIDTCKESGCDLIICSGGMSVDADDITPIAIEKAAKEVITYGSPVIPGAMFMLAYDDETTLIGLPACGMFVRITVFDVLLPRIIANDKITKRDINELSHGGLCLRCETCNYPICPFGK